MQRNEVLLGTPVVADLIRRGEFDEEEALHNADSMNNVRLRIKLAKEERQPEAGKFSLESFASDE